MRINNVGIACFFLILLSLFFFETRGGLLSSSGNASVLRDTNVSWNVDVKKGNVTFVLQNDKGESLRSLHEDIQNQMSVCMVTSSLKQCEEVKPMYEGNGTFTFQHTFSETTTLFLYIKDKETRQELAKTEVITSNDKEKQDKLTVDALLTAKIGAYTTSLQFSSLKPNRQEELKLQFQSNKDITFTSSTGELTRLLIVDENRQHLITAVPQSNKDNKQLIFLVTFPQEGLYKIWGTFYLNGKKYEKSYVIKVGT